MQSSLHAPQPTPTPTPMPQQSALERELQRRKGGAGAKAGGAPPAQPPCLDKDPRCSALSQTGKCQLKETAKWMAENCRRSCGVCGSVSVEYDAATGKPHAGARPVTQPCSHSACTLDSQRCLCLQRRRQQNVQASACRRP